MGEQKPISLCDVTPYVTPESLTLIDWEHLREEFLHLLPIGSKLLDIGAGKGEDSAFFQKNRLIVLTADKYTENLQKADVSTDKVTMDLCHLSLPLNSLDGIWLANVLIFAQDEQRDALQECFRVLKPGGKIFVCNNFFSFAPFTVPLSPDMAEYILAPYSSYKVKTWIEEVGFIILEEKIGIDIPQKRGFGNSSGFHILFGEKP